MLLTVQALLKNDGVSVIKFSLSEQECVLSSKSVEVGSSTEVLSSASFTGSSLEISCNGRYVFDAIKALSGSLVTFRLCGEMKPFIIKSVDDDNVYSWYFQSEPMHKQQAVRGTSCCLFLCILTKVDLFQEWNRSV